jgi:hypothetical protein
VTMRWKNGEIMIILQLPGAESHMLKGVVAVRRKSGDSEIILQLSGAESHMMRGVM